MYASFVMAAATERAIKAVLVSVDKSGIHLDDNQDLRCHPSFFYTLFIDQLDETDPLRAALQTKKDKAHVTLAVARYRDGKSAPRPSTTVEKELVVYYEKELCVFYKDVTMPHTYITANTPMEKIKEVLQSPQTHAIVLMVLREDQFTSKFHPMQQRIVQTMDEQIELVTQHGIELIDPHKYHEAWKPHTTIIDPYMLENLINDANIDRVVLGVFEMARHFGFRFPLCSNVVCIEGVALNMDNNKDPIRFTF